MKKIVPYPSIQTIDLNSTRSWVDGNNYKYYIEEKIDGSQLSMILEDSGTLSFYNKSSLAGEGNTSFTKSISMLKFMFENKEILNKNYIYHGESVCKLKHNVNVYERVPKNYFICYDIFDNLTQVYLSPEMKKEELDRVELEMCPILYYNSDVNVNPYDKCKELMGQIEKGEIVSFLGGIPEGIVLKHHSFVQQYKTSATKLKYVTDTFKERHLVKQPKCEESADDFLEKLGKSFCTEPRFQKAFQHLVDQGKINSDSVKAGDLGKVIGELGSDFDKEYKDEMMLLLWVEFSPVIKKYARDGVGLWFNNKFLNK
jgi:hypothetical protein